MAAYLILNCVFLIQMEWVDLNFRIKRLLAFLLLLSSFCLSADSFCLQAQDTTTDSLLQLIRVAEEDSIKIKTYLQISQNKSGTEPRESLTYARTALDLANQTGYHDKDLFIFLHVGRIENDLGHYPEALEMLDKAIKLAESKSDLLNLGIVHFNYARVYIKQERLALGMEQLVKAEKFFKEISHYRGEGNVRTNIGLISLRQENSQAAKEHFEAALALHQLAKYPSGVAGCHLNLGVICKKQKEYDQALEHYKSAYDYFEEKKIIKEQLLILNNLGSLEADRNQLEEALPYLEKGLALIQQAGNESHLTLKSYLLLNLGDAYMEMSLFAKAAPYFKEAKILADSMNLDNLRLTISQDLAANYDSLGEAEQALFWVREAFVLQDSINQKQQSKKLTEIQTAYKMQNQQEEYEELKRKENVNQLKNIIITLGLISLIVIAIILFVEYRKKIKNNSLLRTMQEDIIAQNATLTDQNERLGSLNQEKNLMMDMLVHDIRDPLSKIEGLSNILLDQEKLNQQQLQFVGHIKQTAQKLTDMSQRLLDLEALEIGKLSLHLEPINFVNIVDESIAAYRATGEKKRIQIKKGNDYQIPMIWADARAFRQVLDNLISNAIKFSPADTEVSINFIQRGNDICIEVTDQGPGISSEEQHKLFEKYQTLSNKPTGGEKSTGLGLALVKKYIEAMEGRIEVESELGKGTSFKVFLPVAPTTDLEETSRA